MAAATARAPPEHPQPVPLHRLTEDDRILSGGYDAVYYWRGKASSELREPPSTWATLSRHFFDTVPELDGVRFSHMSRARSTRCTRVCVLWRPGDVGRRGTPSAITGLGVASTGSAPT